MDTRSAVAMDTESPGIAPTNRPATYVKKGDNFQARATWQSVADGYSPADDGIVDEAKARIAKLN